MSTGNQDLILGVSVDASDAASGFDDVSRAANKMAGEVAQASVKAGKGIDGIGDGAGKSSDQLDKATRNMIGSIQRTTAAMEAGQRGTVKYYEAIANQRSVNQDALKPYLAQLDQAIEKQKLAGASMNNMGLSAGQLSQAMRGVPAQFTDIVVSLQSGQAPMTVLLQQGGQLKDMFGGIGNAAKALGGYVLGLVNPFTVAAGVAATMGYAFAQGSKEAGEMAKAIIMTGNAANTSVNQLKDISSAVSASSGATKGAVIDALNSIVNIGGVASKNLGMVAEAAIRMEKVTGTAVEETVKQFSELGKDPVKASEKLNEQYNYLTASVYRQIKALEDQGRATEAANLAQETFANTLNSRASEMVGNIGSIERAWSGVKGAVTGAWDAMKGIGRVGSLEERRNSALEGLRDGKSGALAEFSVIQAQLESEQKITAEKTKQNELNRAGIQWAQDGDKFLSKKAQMEQEITKARNLGNAAGATELEITKRIAAIREKYTEKGSTGKSQIVKDAEALAAVMDKLTGKDVGLDATYWKDLEVLFSSYKRGALDAEAYSVAVGKLTTNQKFYTDALKDQQKFDSTRASYIADVEKETDALTKKAEAAEFENAKIGMTSDQLAILVQQRNASTIATLEEKAAAIEMVSGRNWEVEAIEQQIDAMKRLQSAEIAKPKLQAQAREWEKFTDDINRSLTDALMRGFESGKSFGQNFVDSLKNSLKTAALRIAVNVVTGTGGSVVNAAINSIGGTDGANGGAGVNYLGLANNANSAYNLYGAGSQFFTGASTGTSSAGLMYANGVQTIGGDGIGALYTANGGWAGVGVDGVGTAAASGAGAGSAGAGASMSVGAAGAYAAAVILLGQALFGSKERYLDTNIQGTLGSGGFTGQFGDRYKTTGNIFGSVSPQADWYPVTDSSADIAASVPFKAKTAVHNLMAPSETGYSEGQEALFQESLDSQLASIAAQSAAFKQALEGVYSYSKNSLQAVANAFDDSTLADKIKDYAVNVDMQFSGEVEKVFANFGETVMVGMGAAWLPSVEALRGSSETWSQALGRLMNETGSVSQIFVAMGKTLKDSFGPNNTDSILRMSDNLVKLFGSVDNLSASFSAYYSNFYSSEELGKKSLEALTAQFTNIGITIPKTRQGFRDIVDSLDLTTLGGQSTFKSLMDLQGAFASLTPTIDEAAAAARAAAEAQAAAAAALIRANQEAQAQQIGQYLDAQRAAQVSLIEKQIGAAQTAAESAKNIAESFAQVVGSLSSYGASLGGGNLSTLSPSGRYAEARRAYEETANKAKLGDLSAAGNLQSVADAFLQLAHQTGTAESYARDFGQVAGSVDAVIAVADRQIPLAESQLEVAQDQLTALNAMLAAMSNPQVSVVANYEQAAADWASFFSGTAIGDVVQTTAGAMQRISETMGMLIDGKGNGYTFSANDGPYGLAGVSEAWQAEMIKRYGQWLVPAFASGGYHKGGLRLVGENGPELEMTGPSSIINTNDTMAMVGSAATLVDEVRALRSEIASLRQEQMAGNAAIASSTSRSARVLDKFDIDGMPQTRAA